MLDRNPGPVQGEFLGYRAVVTGGSWKQVKQAVYTRQQEFESVAVPPPAATPVIEEELKVELTIMWTPDKDINELRDLLFAAGVDINIDISTTGMR